MSLPFLPYYSFLTISFSIRFYLSERFRLRFEDLGDLMEEEPPISSEAESNADAKVPEDEGADSGPMPNPDAAAEFNDLSENPRNNGTIRTLDGEMVGDELEGDAINYNLLLLKVDALLERLKLDA